MKRLSKVRTWQRFAQPLPHQAHKRPPNRLHPSKEEESSTAFSLLHESKKAHCNVQRAFFID